MQRKGYHDAFVHDGPPPRKAGTAVTGCATTAVELAEQASPSARLRSGHRPCDDDVDDINESTRTTALRSSTALRLKEVLVGVAHIQCLSCAMFAEHSDVHAVSRNTFACLAKHGFDPNVLSLKRNVKPQAKPTRTLPQLLCSSRIPTSGLHDRRELVRAQL